ncbi:uncharacterized protein LOC133301910 [Gastrolobium bilobum]|uniref:uncharacterized protein LOC133301910 n=1 Tax=Gastrolobium bilobum TaxID=150636 RepID=UPI002AAF3CA4|nr:uncharacterized protein LOC133301910 [Gastrolobium bilobum]
MVIGLEWAWEMGYQQVVLEIDSLESLKIVQEECIKFHPCHMLITRIEKTLERNWKVELAHINKVANWLAGQAPESNRNIVWYEDPPDGCRDFLLKDCMGVGELRPFSS